MVSLVNGQCWCAIGRLLVISLYFSIMRCLGMCVGHLGTIRRRVGRIICLLANERLSVERVFLPLEETRVLALRSRGLFSHLAATSGHRNSP